MLTGRACLFLHAATPEARLLACIPTCRKTPGWWQTGMDWLRQGTSAAVAPVTERATTFERADATWATVSHHACTARSLQTLRLSALGEEPSTSLRCSHPLKHHHAQAATLTNTRPARRRPPSAASNAGPEWTPGTANTWCTTNQGARC